MARGWHFSLLDTWISVAARKYTMRNSSHRVELRVVCDTVPVTGGVIGPHYASSKAAMHGLIHWLSLRYAKDGIVSSSFTIDDAWFVVYST